MLTIPISTPSSYQTARAGSYGYTKQKSVLIDRRIADRLVVWLQFREWLWRLRRGPIEEDPLDGMNVENWDYTITSCAKDRERPLTSRVSAESQPINLKAGANKLSNII